MRKDIKIIDVTWRNGKENIGFVLVESDAGNQRAYIGTPWKQPDIIDILMKENHTGEPDEEYIANYGCALSFEEAYPFFKEMIRKDNYQEGGDLN